MLEFMDFDYDVIKLTCLYKNESKDSDYSHFKSDVYAKVYGNDLKFPMPNQNRPYIFNSVVTSVDGKIAFNDKPEGPNIASMNKLSNQGALADWWTLNILRASSDAIIFGANTLVQEPNATGHIYDKNLVLERLRNNMTKYPINIIPTLDGKDIPYNHKEFLCNEIPIIIYTTLEGSKFASQKLEDYAVLDVRKTFTHLNQIDSVDRIILICGENGVIDNERGMEALKHLGVQRLLVESPTLTHILLQKEMLDEMFINHSGLYLGGDALSIGSNQKSFDSSNFPHLKLLTLHLHSPYFLYYRYKVIY